MKVKKQVKLIFHLSKDRNESSLLMQHYKTLTHYTNREHLILSLTGCPRAILEKFKACKSPQVNFGHVPAPLILNHILCKAQARGEEIHDVVS